MQIPFSKYQGTGNDFIIIDNRLLQLKLSEKEINLLCHRRFGIGADGFILLNDSDMHCFDMQYYNSDGKEGSMCGNGGRCIAAFARRLQLFEDKVAFRAVDGIHLAEIIEICANETIVKLAMQDVDKIESFMGGYILNTGSPHYVEFVENIKNIDVFSEGKKVRNHPYFKNEDGINVNFVEVKDDHLFVRTYERGVEDETFSCGTGVVASALVYAQKNNVEKVSIETKGGSLQVSFKQSPTGFVNIFLQGKASHVFDGIIETDIF